VARVLEVPDHIKVQSLISIGHPAERKEARTQYDPKHIHRERW
jgi:hypothetical protein